ncbi:MAG: transglycosylase SLT domain-containing protein, partial [Oscillospiraceae bacterium]
MVYKSYIKAQYKTDYSQIVEKYSDEYNIEKSFIYAVIKTESGFNKDAVSNVGARGLM